MPIPQRKTTGLDVAATGIAGIEQALEQDRTRFETDRAFKEQQRLSDADILANAKRLRENARQYNLSQEQENELASIESQLQADLTGIQTAATIGEGERGRKANEVIEARSDKTRRYDISERSNIARQQADLQAQQFRQAAQSGEKLEDYLLSTDWTNLTDKEYLQPDGNTYFSSGPNSQNDTPTGRERYSAGYTIKRQDLIQKILGGTGEWTGNWPTVPEAAIIQAEKIADHLILHREEIMQKRIASVMQYESATSLGQAQGRIAELQAGGGTRGTRGGSSYNPYGVSALLGGPETPEGPKDRLLTMTQDMELFNTQVVSGEDELKIKPLTMLSVEERQTLMMQSTLEQREKFGHVEQRLEDLNTALFAIVDSGGEPSSQGILAERDNILEYIDSTGLYADQQKIQAGLKEHVENTVEGMLIRRQIGIPVLGVSAYEKKLENAKKADAKLKATLEEVDALRARLPPEVIGQVPSAQGIEILTSEAQKNPDAAIDLFYLKQNR